jgi:ABC-type enterochelin transport system ATPase subunit
MNRISYLAPRPFFFVDIHRHCGIPAIRAATAAAGEAIRKMRAVLHDIQRAAVGANHALAMRGHISSTGIR